MLVEHIRLNPGLKATWLSTARTSKKEKSFKCFQLEPWFLSLLPYTEDDDDDHEYAEYDEYDEYHDDDEYAEYDEYHEYDEYAEYDLHQAVRLCKFVASS